MKKSKEQTFEEVGNDVTHQQVLNSYYEGTTDTQEEFEDTKVKNEK